MEDRKKIEAVLFAVGDKIEEAELARLTRLPLETVKAELHKLKEDYSQAQSTFIVLNEGTKWKLTVGEDYMPIVQKIVPKTELSRPVLETLAVIAWKSPVLQSNIINIRSSKGYDHIAELEQVGFITKQKYGRSFMLRLSQQFFEYFDIKGKEQIKDVFKGIKGTEQIASPDKKLHEFAGKGEKTKEEPETEAKPEAESRSDANLPMELTPVPTLPALSESKEPALPMTQPVPEKAVAGQEPPKPATPTNSATPAPKQKKEKKPKAE